MEPTQPANQGRCKITRWQLLKQQLNNLEPTAFREAIHCTPKAILLDVRTQQEYDQGALPGARHFNYLDYGFLDQLEQLDKEATYLVYCRTGRRSIRTCTLMQNGGFRHVFNLDGGLLAWNAHFGPE